jgi:hypothetical protein
MMIDYLAIGTVALPGLEREGTSQHGADTRPSHQVGIIWPLDQAASVHNW